MCGTEYLTLCTFCGLLIFISLYPGCAKISLTSVSHCYLPPPLSLKKDITVLVLLVSTDLPLETYPVLYGCASDAMSEICDVLLKLFGIASENMEATHVYTHKFHKISRWIRGLEVFTTIALNFSLFQSF